MTMPTRQASIILADAWMEHDILEADANLSVCAVWANHCDSTERIMFGGLNKLKDFAVSRKKDIALFEFGFHIVISFC